ncbi:MAG: hypothetical protein HONBIEJF_01283 [Fimbriimonadaceae bacterium]|nr:hypothetical protein [Fimbriimonadaceae bacterium]
MKLQRGFLACGVAAMLSVAAYAQPIQPTIRHKGQEVKLNSVSSIARHVERLKAEHAKQARESGKEESALGKHEEMEEAGTDYWEAYLHWLKLRAYPNDSVDWTAYQRAVQQRAVMEPAPLGKARRDNKGPIGDWIEQGPKNLDVPYRVYYGIRPTTGRINAVAVHPTDSNTVYVGGATGGVWKTTDGGGNWLPLSDAWEHLAVNRIAIDPVTPNTIYVGTGDFHGGYGYVNGLMKSTDAGATWTKLGAEFAGLGVTGIIVDPETPANVTVTTGGGPVYYGKIYRSTDGGATFTATNSVTTAWSNVRYGIPSGQDRTYYAVGSGNNGGTIQRSADRGATWETVAAPAAGGVGAIDVAPSMVDANTVYLLQSDANKIFKSTDRGTNWTDITNNFPGGYNWSQAWYNYHIECSSRTVGNQTNDVLYVGQIDIIQSEDGGTTWRSVGGPTYTDQAITHNDQHSGAFAPSNPNLYYFGCDGGIFRLNYDPTNGSFTVDRLSAKLNTTQFYEADWHPSNPKIMIGGTQDNATPVSKGDTANWANQGGGDGGGCAINPSNPNIQYATSQFYGIYRTTDLWNTTQYIAPNFGGDRMPFIGAMYVDPNPPHDMYVGTNYLWRWNETLQTWQPRLGNQILSPGSVVISFAIAQGDSNMIVTGSGDGQLWWSQDAGLSWTQINTGASPLPNRAITGISINPKDKKDVLVSLSGTGTAHVWRCRDITAGGRTWSTADGSGNATLPDIPVNDICRDIDDDQNTWYVGNDVGVFMTTDGGVTWTNATNTIGLPNVGVTAIKAVKGSRTLNVATWGRGFWQIPLNTSTIKGLTLQFNQITGGTSVTGTVTLDEAAPTGGTKIDLSVDKANIASVPSSIVIPEGSDQGSFTVQTVAVKAKNTVTIMGKQGSIVKTVQLDVLPPQISFIGLKPPMVTGGNSSQGTVTLTGPAGSGGLEVALSSNTDKAIVPAKVVVPADGTTVNFVITTKSVGGQTTATITGTTSDSSSSAALVINPPKLRTLTVTPRRFKSGKIANALIKIAGKAPDGGLQITASSSDASVTVPATVSVPAGKDRARFTIKSKKVSALRDVTITLTLGGDAMVYKITLRP